MSGIPSPLCRPVTQGQKEQLWCWVTLNRLNTTIDLFASLSSYGFSGSMLVSIEVTVCIPGHELLPTEECTLCPASYFCVGGSNGHESCPTATVSIPGMNLSAACVGTLVYVIIIISIPMP